MILAELRAGETLRALADSIRRVPLTRPVRLMEVCGGHTAVIHRYALHGLLEPAVDLLSGPGCPVCVTDDAFIDACIELTQDRRVILATFGDLIRVPGSMGSLATARAAGGDVRVFYSPAAALEWARGEPDRTVVLAGIGFETTACTLAAVMQEAIGSEVRNLRMLSVMKTMPAALRALVEDADSQIDGFILPGHVLTVTGTAPFQFLAEEFGVPCAVSGFEPADVMLSILSLVKQIHSRSPRIDIQYTRSVRPEGNAAAQRTIGEVLEPCTTVWRGLGAIHDSGLRLQSRYAAWDAACLIGTQSVNELRGGCQCGEILRGKLRPSECLLFGTACTPETPQGACMVSSEGACAAAYQFAPAHA